MMFAVLFAIIFYYFSANKKEVVMATTKKAAPAEKKAGKKTAAKKPAKLKGVTSEVHIQYQHDGIGHDLTADELPLRVKEIWTKEMGNLVRDLKDIKIYVNADESMAYYVINDDVEGKFAL